MTRIGLIGYRSQSGLGELNRQIAEHVELTSWLIVSHRNRPADPSPLREPTRAYTQADSEEFVRSADVILFCETPFYTDLLQSAKEKGKRIVCVPMLEWTPDNRNNWTSLVDLFVCPTKQCYDVLLKEGLPCKYFPWPVDIDRFQYKQRTLCESFLFINGWGGWSGRKGASVVVQAKEAWPEMPLTVYSQANFSWPKGTKILPSPENNRGLYAAGDVLIAPHTVDGLGLEPMEAMACGMPVITPSAPPWNENPAVARIATHTIRKRVKRMMNWESCSGGSLASLCKFMLGKDITRESLTARQWAEDRSWLKRTEEFLGFLA